MPDSAIFLSEFEGDAVFLSLVGRSFLEDVDDASKQPQQKKLEFENFFCPGFKNTRILTFKGKHMLTMSQEM